MERKGKYLSWHHTGPGHPVDLLWNSETHRSDCLCWTERMCQTLKHQNEDATSSHFHSPVIIRRHHSRTPTPSFPPELKVQIDYSQTKWVTFYTLNHLKSLWFITCFVDWEWLRENHQFIDTFTLEAYKRHLKANLCTFCSPAKFRSQYWAWSHFSIVLNIDLTIECVWGCCLRLLPCKFL
jgi:hypothetical protein